MMKLFLAVVILLNLTVAINAIKKQTVTFGYKEGRTQAFTSSTWIDPNCLSYSTVSVFGTDGYFDAIDEDKVTFKTVSGNGAYFTDCTETGATLVTIDFGPSDPKKLIFNDKKTGKNATVSATLDMYYESQECDVVSETYIDPFDGTEYINFYYECTGAVEQGLDTISVDSFLRVTPGAEVYTTKLTESRKGIGYVQKFETKSTCQAAVVTRKVIKIGNKRLNIPSFSTYGEICKIKEGRMERITFV